MPDFLPFAEGDVPGFRVTHRTRAHCSVRLWGHFGPLWADAFCLGLSSRDISILRGFARQDGVGRWVAELLLAPGTHAPELASLDFLALALGPHATGDGAPVVLTHYALDGGPEAGPTLYLEVRGPDRLGFLGSLLRVLARLGLSPREMRVTTPGGTAFDRFYLKTVSGGVPSDDVRRALRATLEAAVVAGGRSAVARVAFEPMAL
jgi:hypothetical protein